MFFAELAQVLLRRWYLVVLTLSLTAGAALATLEQTSPTYTASAEVLLLPPPTSVAESGNPYLSLGGLTPAGDVLSKALTDFSTASALRPAGATADYVVELDGDTPAPIVSVSVEGKTAAETMRTLQVVLDRLPTSLIEIQRAANVPANAFITSTPVTISEVPEKGIKSQIRAMVVVGGGLFVLGLLGTAAIDALLRRPRRSRRERDTDARSAAADSGDLDCDPAPGRSGAVASPRGHTPANGAEVDGEVGPEFGGASPGLSEQLGQGRSDDRAPSPVVARR